MCVRIVFLLVLCCVTSWAQRDWRMSRGYQNQADNPGMLPQGRPPSEEALEIPGIPQQPWVPNRSPSFEEAPEVPGAPEQPWFPDGIPPPVIIVQTPGQGPHYPGPPDVEHPHKMPPSFDHNADDRKPSDAQRNVELPRELKYVAKPLEGADHALQLNVSWLPPMDFPVQSYSIELTNLSKTEYCNPRLCTTDIYNETATWALIPAELDTRHGGCIIHPGCSYLVKLTASPSNGFNTANLNVTLEDCVAGICSCAHTLPTPVVFARRNVSNGDVFADIGWHLPAPSRHHRLPPQLSIKSYVVRLKKAITTIANSKPLFEYIEGQLKIVEAKGLVLKGDTEHSVRLNITQEMMLNKQLLAVVQLMDKRDCVGSEGNAMVFDPDEVRENEQKESKSRLSFGVYAILGALIGAWAMGAVFVLSARVVKRVLKSFRPAPVSAPLEPLRRRPAWFPLQLRT